MNNTGDGSTITLSAWQALGFDANSLLAGTMNSLFTNYSANDFSLVSGSQAINAGTSLVSSVVTDDYAGVGRPNNSTYDIGAYEFVHNKCVYRNILG